MSFPQPIQQPVPIPIYLPHPSSPLMPEKLSVRSPDSDLRMASTPDTYVEKYYDYYDPFRPNRSQFEDKSRDTTFCDTLRSNCKEANREQSMQIALITVGVFGAFILVFCLVVTFRYLKLCKLGQRDTSEDEEDYSEYYNQRSEIQLHVAKIERTLRTDKALDKLPHVYVTKALLTDGETWQGQQQQQYQQGQQQQQYQQWQQYQLIKVGPWQSGATVVNIEGDPSSNNTSPPQQQDGSLQVVLTSQNKVQTEPIQTGSPAKTIQDGNVEMQGRTRAHLLHPQHTNTTLKQDINLDGSVQHQHAQHSHVNFTTSIQGKENGNHEQDEPPGIDQNVAGSYPHVQQNIRKDGPGSGQGARQELLGSCSSGSASVQHVGAWQGDSCTICLEEWVEGAHVVTLPCGHRFHRHCAREWAVRLPRGNERCPVCSAPMFPPGED